MRRKRNKLSALLLAGLCFLSVAEGCGSEKNQVPAPEPITDETEAPEEIPEDTPEEVPVDTPEDEPEKNRANVGDFSMEDINGESFTKEMLAENQLTMINVFATWCSPCINEIPDLEQLSQDMADQEVQVVGIVLDAIGPSGEVDTEAVEKARLLAERLEVTYPFLIPDETYLNGMLFGISAVPTTFFVDGEGNLVGEAYLGSRSLEDWASIVEAKLKELEP